MINKFSLAVGACVLAVAAPGIAATLVTPLAGGNSQSGIMFDVVIKSSALTLQSIGVNISDGTYDFEFYTLAGGVGGNTGDSTPWTLRNSFSGVTTAGPGNLTTFDITDLGLAANTTYGIYFTSTVASGGIVRYTNGSDVGDTVAGNADLSILSGYGKSYPFTNTYQPRNFNGELTYSLNGAVPEPASWALMIGGFGLVGASLRRRREAVSAA